MYFLTKWGAKEPQNPQNHRVDEEENDDDPNAGVAEDDFVSGDEVCYHGLHPHRPVILFQFDGLKPPKSGCWFWVVPPPTSDHKNHHDHVVAKVGWIDTRLELVRMRKRYVLVSLFWLWYYWWFRNPKQPPGMYKTIIKPVVNSRINYQPQLLRRTSEPSTVCSIFWGKGGSLFTKGAHCIWTHSASSCWCKFTSTKPIWLVNQPWKNIPLKWWTIHRVLGLGFSFSITIFLFTILVFESHSTLISESLSQAHFSVLIPGSVLCCFFSPQVLLWPLMKVVVSSSRYGHLMWMLLGGDE